MVVRHHEGLEVGISSNEIMSIVRQHVVKRRELVVEATSQSSQQECPNGTSRLRDLTLPSKIRHTRF